MEVKEWELREGGGKGEVEELEEEERDGNRKEKKLCHQDQNGDCQ